VLTTEKYVVAEMRWWLWLNLDAQGVFKASREWPVKSLAVMPPSIGE
jgi:hypothetical protein